MKKLFALALTLVMLTSALAVCAITLDAAEGGAVLASEQKIGKYGIVLMQDDFSDGQKNEPTYKADSVSVYGLYGDSANVSVAADPADENGLVLKAFHPDGTTSGFRQLVIGFESETVAGIPVEAGTYTFVYDEYNPVAVPDTYMSRMFFAPNGKDIFSKYNDSTAKNNPGVWTRENTMSVTVTENEDGTFTANFGTATDTATAIKQLRVCAQGVEGFYLDNVGLYFIPEGTAVISNGVDGYILENIGDTFTFPKPSEVNSTWADALETGSYLWLVGGKTSYLPGDKVDASVVLNKVISLDVIKTPLFSEKYGDLVLFMDFEAPGAGYFTSKYRNAEYMASDITSLLESNSLKSLTVTKLADGNTAVKFDNSHVSDSGFGFFNYKVSIPVNGKYTTMVDARAMDGVANATDYFSGAFIRLRTKAGASSDAGGDLSFNGTKWVTMKNSLAREDLEATGLNISVKAVENIDTMGDYYYDNFTIYVFPFDLAVFKASEDATDYVRVEAADGYITFPTPEELGFDGTGFVLWTSDSGKTYKPGDVVAVADAGAEVYYPFSQTADVPAMGFSYEGAEGTLGGFTYSEHIFDEGRSVAHLHQYKKWNESQKAWSFDSRISFYSADRAFDPKEYPIVEYMYKIGKATKVADGYSNDKTYDPAIHGAPIAVAEPNMAFWYATPRSTDPSSYWIANNGENKITGGNIKIQADGKYHKLSYDMRFEKSNAKDPFVDATLIGGFAFDPSTTNWENDIYIDYVRAYRSGLTTVTYDTNAPEGATNVVGVDPDENRGLGYGYLLTGEKPLADGYTFVGWAEKADAGIEDVVESIHLKGDTTVYAVWVKNEEYAAPEFGTEVEIKGTGTNNGIRFKSEILPSVKNNLDEFGFIATREVLLPKTESEYNHDALTFLLKKSGVNEALFAKGIAYDADGEIDIINSEKDSGEIIYTALITGITAENKNENIVVRPYAVFAVNGINVTVYGETASSSLYNAAKAVKDAGGEAYENNKTYIDSIVTE